MTRGLGACKPVMGHWFCHEGLVTTCRWDVHGWTNAVPSPRSQFGYSMIANMSVTKITARPTLEGNLINPFRSTVSVQAGIWAELMLFRQILKYSEDMKWPVLLSICNYIISHGWYNFVCMLFWFVRAAWLQLWSMYMALSIVAVFAIWQYYNIWHTTS